MEFIHYIECEKYYVPPSVVVNYFSKQKPAHKYEVFETVFLNEFSCEEKVGFRFKTSKIKEFRHRPFKKLCVRVILFHRYT